MPVDAIPPGGASPVTGAIRQAARVTGADFQYLLATAKVESDLNPGLAARSSTATGVFQFIEQTWLATLKQAGPAFGYGHYADAISEPSSGYYAVEDAALRAEIMQLRKDPTANALMGGVFTQQNAAVMAARLGRTPTEGELYIGHFFGPYAGTKALELAINKPNAIAADLFPTAAQANRPIFYDKQGKARTIAGVCEELARRYHAARAPAKPLVPSVAPVSIPTASLQTTSQRPDPGGVADDCASGRAGLFRERPVVAVACAGSRRQRDRHRVPYAFSVARAARRCRFLGERALERARTDAGHQPASHRQIARFGRHPRAT